MTKTVKTTTAAKTGEAHSISIADLAMKQEAFKAGERVGIIRIKIIFINVYH